MRFGISLPNFGEFYQPAVLADLAKRGEDSGFDGFFIWDHMLFWRNFRQPVVDPWVALAAIAVATKSIRIGPMVTPVARRRPWKLARETVSLDHLSNGRLIVGVGLGSPADADFETFGESGDEKVRAEKLDDSGAGNRSDTKAATSGSLRTPFCRPRCRSHGYLSGSLDCGRTRHPSGELPAGTACFRSHAI